MGSTPILACSISIDQPYAAPWAVISSSTPGAAASSLTTATLTYSNIQNKAVSKNELNLLHKLDDLGIRTVNVRDPVKVGEQSGLVFDRFEQGSKEIIKLENGKVRIVGESPLLNQQSIADLKNIRKTVVDNKIQINDLQFLIGKDGRVVVADPLAVNLNTVPSKNNLRMIDLLIESAKKNGK